MARDLAQQILKPAAAAAGSADPAAQQFTEEGLKPAANIVADAVQPVAKGFTDQTLLPTAQKVSIYYVHDGFAACTFAQAQDRCRCVWVHLLVHLLVLT